MLKAVDPEPIAHDDEEAVLRANQFVNYLTISTNNTVLSCELIKKAKDNDNWYMFSVKMKERDPDDGKDYDNLYDVYFHNEYIFFFCQDDKIVVSKACVPVDNQPGKYKNPDVLSFWCDLKKREEEEDSTLFPKTFDRYEALTYWKIKSKN
jgi:hypothetical protein